MQLGVIRAQQACPWRPDRCIAQRCTLLAGSSRCLAAYVMWHEAIRQQPNWRLRAARQAVLGASPQKSPEEVQQDLLSALLDAAKGVRHIAHQVGVSAQFGQLLHDNNKGG